MKAWSKGALALALAALGPLSAHATVLDFNNLAHDDYYVAVNPVSTSGYLISGDGGTTSLGVWGSGNAYQADPGHAAVFVNNGGTVTTVARLDGLAFDFYAIDLADVYNSGVSSTIEFTFQAYGGGSTTTSVTLDNAPGLQTFVFDQQGLQAVSWVTTNGDSGWGQFDNIHLSAVPEADAAIMAVAGLAIAAVATGRRRMPHWRIHAHIPQDPPIRPGGHPHA